MNYIYQVWEYYNSCEIQYEPIRLFGHRAVDHDRCIINFASLPDALAFANEYMQERVQEAITDMSEYYEDYPLTESSRRHARSRFHRWITTKIYPIRPVDEHKYNDGTIYKGWCIPYTHTFCEFSIRKVPLY